jgi:hypothetical protein
VPCGIIWVVPGAHRVVDPSGAVWHNLSSPRGPPSSRSWYLPRQWAQGGAYDTFPFLLHIPSPPHRVKSQHRATARCPSPSLLNPSSWWLIQQIPSIHRCKTSTRALEDPRSGRQSLPSSLINYLRRVEEILAIGRDGGNCGDDSEQSKLRTRTNIKWKTVERLRPRECQTGATGGRPQFFTGERRKILKESICTRIIELIVTSLFSRAFVLLGRNNCPVLGILPDVCVWVCVCNVS